MKQKQLLKQILSEQQKTNELLQVIVSNLEQQCETESLESIFANFRQQILPVSYDTPEQQ